MAMNYCIYGDAKGADLEWGLAAKAAGHKVIHYVFENHKENKGQHSVVLSQEELDTADPYLRTANKSLKRSFPTRNGFVNNLLRRNYFQVKDSKRLYAVVNGFDPANPKVVQGGTAWAVQMFIDLNPNNSLYVFNQSEGVWYTWEVGVEDDAFEATWGWNKTQMIPTPYGIYAAVGTRELTDIGKQAISELFNLEKIDDAPRRK